VTPAPDGHQQPGVLGSTVTLSVRPITDWHVGAGTGLPAAVDALVRRDRDGLPYLPGTTVTGVLRDGCRTVARALDGAAPGPWTQWHRVIFGDAPDRDGPSAGRRLRPAALAIGPARLDPPLRSLVAADLALTQATTFVKPGVRIDPQTGRALDDMLRFVEMARAGLPLQAEVTLALPEDGDAATAATALLVLGAAWCDRLGGDRRRGAGQVTLTWAGHRAPAWARWLRESGWTPSSPKLPAQRQAATPGRGSATSSGGGWVRIPLTISTEQAVRVPRQTTGNLIRGHDHLPGSLLLPWLSQHLGADRVRAAVAADALTVRHAHPEIAGERSVPVPFVLAAGKYPDQQQPAGAGLTVYNTLRQHPPVGKPAKQVRGLWTLPAPTGDGGVALARMPMEELSHNAVNRATQRPDSEAGLYTVEAIPAGRRLRTEVLVSAEIAAQLGERWWTALDGTARLGSRRRGEYGLASVRAGEPRSDPVAPDPPRVGEVFALWAVTDLVVRSPRLRLSADPLDVVAALRDQLDGGGLTLALEPGSVTRTQRRDSWQSAWQLPRDSVVGLAAGSLLALRVVGGAVDPAAWRDLLRRGLGERRAEGFGEVLAGAPLLAASTLPLVPLPTATAETRQEAADGELSGAQRAALDVLTRVARDAAVRDAARALRELDEPPVAYTRLRSALDRLSPSQRGTWRTVLADAMQRRNRQRADQELDRWQRYRDKRRTDQREVAQAIAALLGGGITTVLASVGTPLSDDGWARLDATAVLLDDLVDAARRQSEPGQAEPGQAEPGQSEPPEAAR
jgi:CRISPR-associated protein Csx10